MAGTGEFVISMQNFSKYQPSMNEAPVCSTLLNSYGKLPTNIHAEIMVSILGEKRCKHKATGKVLPHGTLVQVYGRFGHTVDLTNRDPVKKNPRPRNLCYTKNKGSTGPTRRAFLYHFGVQNSGRSDVSVHDLTEGTQATAEQGESSMSANSKTTTIG